MDIKGNRKKMLRRFLLIIVIMGILIYTFRDQAGPIWSEVKKTEPVLLLQISVSAMLYNVIEGWVLCSMMRQANPGFSLKEGIFCSCYSSFYRVATMGSGSGVASIVYLNRRGIGYSRACGYYIIHYMLHKLTTVITALLFFFLNYKLMKSGYREYFRLILAGIFVAVIICLVIVLVCCGKRLHQRLILLLKKFDRKSRWSDKINEYQKFFVIMEQSGAEILTNPKLVISIIARNILKCLSWYVIPYLLLRQAYSDGILVYTGLTALSVVLASVIPTPAGIGSTEVVFAMLFAALTSTSVAGSIALLYRFATFVVPFLFGGILAGITRLLQNSYTGRT